MYGTLIKSGIKKHFGILVGIFILMLTAIIAFGTALTVRQSSEKYIDSRLTEMSYGDLTVWVSSVDIDKADDEISSLDEVQSVNSQELIFTDYTANGENLIVRVS